MSVKDSDSLLDLDRAWDEMLAQLNLAREAMSDPSISPPPQGDRNNAEGYRYMLGHLHRLLEAEVQQDPDFPYIQTHPGPMSKYTIDNADCLYQYAPIRPNTYYRLSGRVENHEHWQGSASTEAKWRAPNYLIFETHSVAPGDSGTLRELTDGSRVVVANLDSNKLVCTADGYFEILIGPSRPDGHDGNFIASHATQGSALPRGDTARSDVDAPYFYIRQLFADWERERPISDLFIERIHPRPRYPSARTANATAAQLRKVGDLTLNHMRYWTALYGEMLDPFQQASQKRPSHLPVNQLYSPKMNSTQGGGGQSTNAMTGGIFKLGIDEAMLIEITIHDIPDQMGFHLANYWGESYDFGNRVTSLNQKQSFQSGDGVYRYVVSRKDPGIQNWLDTQDYETGYLTLRFTYSDISSDIKLPEISTKEIALKDVAQYLPSDTPRYSLEDREQQLAIRRRHVARRYGH